MVLDRYYKAKTRLKATLPALRSIRSRAKGDAGSVAVSCLDSVCQLREVFRCAVCGLPGSGVRTLIEVVKEETGGRVVLDVVAVTEGGATESHRKRLESYDAVVCVLDAIDPWATAMWSFFTTLPIEFQSKFLFVVERCDLREHGELATVLGHMDDELHRRMGQRYAVVQFSAKLAKMAAGDCANPVALREQSGVDELCAALDAVLFKATGCIDAVRAVTASGLEVVEALRFEMGEIADEVEETDAICQEIEQLAENLLGRVAGRLSPVLAKVDGEIMDVVVAAEEQLTVNRGKEDPMELASQLQKRIADGIAAASERSLTGAAERMEEQLSRNWAHLGRHLREQYGSAFRSKDLNDVAWQKQRQPFLEAGKQRLQSKLDAVRVEEQLAIELARPAMARRRMVIGIIMVIAIGLAVGLLLKQWLIAGACMTAVAIPVFIYVRWAKKWRQSSAQMLWDALDSHRESIEQATAAVLKEDTRIYADEFRTRVQQLAARAEKSRDKKEPVLSDFSEFEKAIVEVRAMLNGGA